MLDVRNDNHPLLRLGLELFDADIHQSSINLSKLCPRKFLFSERFHLVPRGRYTSGTNRGSWFHYAISLMWSGVPQQEALARTRQTAGGVVDTLMEDADNLGMLPGGKSVDQMVSKVLADVDTALAMASFVYQEHPLPPNFKYELLGNELTLRVKYFGLTCPVRGTLDALVRNTETGEVWIVDHKTTSDSCDVAAAIYPLAIQPRLYRRLAHAYLGETPVGVIHNVIQTPTIRLKKNQTWDEYLVEIGEYYRGEGSHSSRADGWSKTPPFLRSWLRFTGNPEDLELDDALEDTDFLSHGPVPLRRFPTCENGCKQYNSLCEYIHLCRTDTAKWGEVIEQFYTIGHRDDDAEDLVQITIGETNADLN